MPIAFPIEDKVSVFSAVRFFSRPAFDVVPSPNLGRPGVVFKTDSLAPGIGLTKARPNVRRLGFDYIDAQLTSVVNPLKTEYAERPFTDMNLYVRQLGALGMMFSGVSRDATGAVLAGCRVLVFREADKALVTETTSDGSGVWTTELVSPSYAGPAFYVAYKVGPPDVFGSSAKDKIGTAVGG